MRTSRAWLAAALFFLVALRAGAATPQAPDSTLQELILRDGTHAVGHVEPASAGQLRFRTQAGALLEVDEAQVLSLRPLATAQALVQGPVWPEDPNGTRLVFAPTARSLRPGQASFGVYELFFPNLQVGLAPRISLGGGTPLFSMEGHRIFWVTPKLQLLQQGNAQLAVGAMHFFGVSDVNGGLAFAVATLGPRDRAVTLGLGAPYTGKLAEKETMALVGAEARLSPRAKLLTENYLIRGGSLFSGGVRWIGDRLSADLALVVPSTSEGFVFFPMVNFVYTFGGQER